MEVISIISPTILIAIGLFLIAIEAMSFSFISFWFGLASILIGIATNFIDFNDGLWQIASICILALVLLFSLRTKLMEKFLKSKDQEINDTFLNEKGEGVIKNGKVEYKATYWDIDSKDTDFKEGEKVVVLSALRNKAKIEKYK
ncbi:MAG: nodulation efficiency protein D [Campylobacterales bacterium]|nr:nodulation efficiency protein D [Campylobacterales bacterium]